MVQKPYSRPPQTPTTNRRPPGLVRPTQQHLRGQPHSRPSLYISHSLSHPGTAAGDQSARAEPAPRPWAIERAELVGGGDPPSQSTAARCYRLSAPRIPARGSEILIRPPLGSLRPPTEPRELDPASAHSRQQRHTRGIFAVNATSCPVGSQGIPTLYHTIARKVGPTHRPVLGGKIQVTQSERFWGSLGVLDVADGEKGLLHQHRTRPRR